jgi:nucleotide-binding universal stress UspA family protein
MYKRILCPIDGSSTSNRGMGEAINLAKDQKAKLKFFHVIDTYFPIIDGVGNYVPVNMEDVLRDNAEEVIKKAQSTAEKAGVTSDAEFVETLGGRPATSIIEEADKWHADLIVMGTHGLRGFSRIVMGSDAENVVRTSAVPVMLVSDLKKTKKS